MTTPPMGGFASEKKWPEGAIEDWQHGASYGWIEETYGRSYSTVAKLIRQAQALGTERVVDISKRARKGGRIPYADQKPISADHQHVGIRMNKFREIDNAFTYQEMADKISVNRMIVRKMELGLHDFTISELTRIATTMETSVEELMKPFS